MTQSSATASIKMLIVIFALAATPAISFAQGGASGSTTDVANAPAPPPGTNNLGTAQSSGANTAPGVTTGAVTGVNPDANAAVSVENRLLDKKMKSICRGC